MAIVAAGAGGCLTDDIGYDEHLVETRDEAGMASIAVMNVTRWEDIAAQLQTDFKLSADEALAKVVPTSAYGNLSIRDVFGFSAGISLPTSSLSKSATTTTTDGVTTSSTTKTKESGPGTAPEAPALLDPSSQVGTPLAAASDKEPGIDPTLQYQAAKALYEEVKLLNNAINNLAIRDGEEAFVVRLKVGVIPFARRQPYDVYTRISFFLGDPAVASQPPPTPVPAAIRDLQDSQRDAERQLGEIEKTLSVVKQRSEGAAKEQAEMLQGQLESLKRHLDTVNARIRASRRELEKAQESLKSGMEARRPRTLRVVPLLATDVLEASLQSRAEDEVRQFGLAVALMIQGVGANADLDKLNEILKAYKAREYSSLLTISPLTETAVQARFGAHYNSAGRYSMQERSQVITVLVIAPKNAAAAPDVQAVARTVFRNANTGMAVPPPSRAKIAAELRKTVMPLFPGRDLKISETYTEDFTRDNLCETYLNGDPDKASDPQLAFLRELYRLVVRNDVTCFIRALHAAGGSWNTPYWQTVWGEIAGISAASEYSSVAFSLPKGAKLEQQHGTALLLDDGKQTRTSVMLKQQVAPARITARLDIADGTPLYGSVGPGVNASVVNIAFPSLKALGLPTDKLALKLYSNETSAPFSADYRLLPDDAAAKAPAKPMFKVSQTTKTIVAARDSSGSARITLELSVKDDLGQQKTIADKVVLSVANAEFRSFEPKEAATATGADITVARNATLVLGFMNLVPGQPVTVTAAGTLGKDKVGELPISFNVAGPR